jgi:hypothetical protein
MLNVRSRLTGPTRSRWMLPLCCFVAITLLGSSAYGQVLSPDETLRDLEWLSVRVEGTFDSKPLDVNFLEGIRNAMITDLTKAGISTVPRSYDLQYLRATGGMLLFNVYGIALDIPSSAGRITAKSYAVSVELYRTLLTCGAQPDTVDGVVWSYRNVVSGTPNVVDNGIWDELASHRQTFIEAYRLAHQ